MSTNLSQLTPWRGPTAPPPQMVRIDPATLTMMREQMINVHALAELTGIPTLYRWGRAIIERRPIHEIEREYFERIFRQLQQVGATAPVPPRLEVQQLRGVVPVDYIVEGRREPPTVIQVPERVSKILAPDLPEDVKRKMQIMGVPTSAEDVAAQVAGRSMVLAAAVLPPGLAGLTREAAKQLAKIAATGFGVGGTGAATARVVQGFPEEAPKAFLEVGLASTVVADIASALRGLATNVSVPQLRDATRQVLLRRQQQEGRLTWRDPEGEAFVKEIEDAVLRLKRGDASKYEALVKQMEEWQKKIDEFQKLYELRQRGELPPDKEYEYTKLWMDVLKIRDRYEDLKMYIEAARAQGVEERYLQPLRDVERLAEAARQAPPGPPPRDVLQRLAEMDYERLRRIVIDPAARASLARRLGVDEQTLAEHAVAFLKQRQWEKMTRFTNEELRRILTDRDLLKKYADEFGMSQDELMVKIEEILQQRGAPKTESPKAESQPERPPIERIAPKRDQFKPPETLSGAEGAVATREGQILIVRPKEEGRITVARLEELPDVQTRLRALRGRLKEEGRATVRASDEQTPRARAEEEPKVGARQQAETSPRQEEVQTPKAFPKADQEVAPKTVAEEVLVLDRSGLRALIPMMPASVFNMPATETLAYVSRIVGMPVALAPGIPRPSPRESFGAWLDRVFAGTGFKWRSLAAQREVFVFA